MAKCTACTSALRLEHLSHSGAQLMYMRPLGVPGDTGANGGYGEQVSLQVMLVSLSNVTLQTRPRVRILGGAPETQRTEPPAP